MSNIWQSAEQNNNAEQTNKITMAHGSGGVLMRQIIDEVFLAEFHADSGIDNADSKGGTAKTNSVNSTPAPTPTSATIIPETTQHQSDKSCLTNAATESRGDDAFVGLLTDTSTNLTSSNAPLLNAGKKIAMSTDSFVVSPRFFAGGDIGKLAVCGTVNDVSTSGAIPKYMSCGFILEEGFAIDELRKICKSMFEAAKEAGVQIVTGDTKVVEKGKCDGVFINTCAVGIVPQNISLSGKNCKAGDKILLSGEIGNHGIAIMSARDNLGFNITIESDVAPLNHLVQDVLKAAPHTHAFRDPTRGGLSATLNELAAQSHVEMTIWEESVPVSDEVRGYCDLLGFDVFQVANEGKMVCIVPPSEADAALTAMQHNKYGKNAAIIGEIDTISSCPSRQNPDCSSSSPLGAHSFRVQVKNSFGGSRILDVPIGEQLPRIC